MKNHDLAKALRAIANLLDSSPDMSIEHMRIVSKDAPNMSNTQVAVSLNTLAELARVDKQQWQELISEFGFPIQVRSRDASRDILGKLLSYLELHDEAREQLKMKVASKVSQASPELMKALSTLMRGTP